MRTINAMCVGLGMIAVLCLVQGSAVAGEGRTTLSLNGTWQIAESVSTNDIPTTFDHTVVVPGLVNLAKPAFPDEGLFASRECLQRFGRKYPFGGPDILKQDAPLPVIGISLQKRNYFWYEYAIRDKGRYVRLLFEDGTDHRVGDIKVVELVEVWVVKAEASAAAAVPPVK